MGKKLRKGSKDGVGRYGNPLVKTGDQIDGIRACAKVTARILNEIKPMMVPGVKTLDIDQRVYDLALAYGAYPATIGYQGYRFSSCISMNEVVCHGIPGHGILKVGDIVNVDIALKKEGYFSDASKMYCIGQVSDKAKRLVDVTEECLYRAIAAVKPGVSLALVAKAIEPYANDQGYSVVRDLAGHGIGLSLHEDPEVNHYVSGETTVKMVPGLVFTIEPMVNEKQRHIKVKSDGWTVVTADGGLSAQWEHTVLVTETGVEVLTQYDD